MARRKGLTAAYEALPKLIKIILQIFFGVLIGGIYRIVRFFESGGILKLIVGLLVLFTGIGNLIIWIVDLVTEILFDRITLFA